MKFYCIEMEGGAVAVMQCFDGVTPQECIAKWPASERVKVVGHPVEVPFGALPTTRAYRDAWCLRGRQVQYDMAKARGIHRDKLRRARAPLLSQLDLDYMRADEDGDQEGKARVVARKKRLRDITKLPEIDQAATIEELAKVWPDELK